MSIEAHVEKDKATVVRIGTVGTDRQVALDKPAHLTIRVLWVLVSDL